MKNNLKNINEQINKTYNYIKVESYDFSIKRFNCRCICGKLLLKRKFELKNMISCGCKKAIDLTNKKSGKLLYVEKVDKKWKCICDCGKIVYHEAKDFKKSKSCGCSVKEASKINIEKAIYASLLKTDKLAHIRKQFNKTYKDGDLTFDDFLDLSQKDCFYCGSKPSNFKKSQNTREEFKIDFYYNGLDRVDNNLKHTKENVVPCCKICNFGKSDMNYYEFISLVKKIQVNKFVKYNLITIEKKHYKLFKHYRENYSDGLSFEEFVVLSQQECFYCGIEPSNDRYGIRWNGVDRLDSDLDHNINNCVPCCKHCNRFKRDLSLEDFYSHVKKIKINLGLNDRYILE